MLKAAIILCSISTAAGGTVLWVKSAGETNHETTGAAVKTISFQELHSNAHLDNLPIQKQP